MNTKHNKKELVFYFVVLFGLIVLVVCNNKFWKLGKKQYNNKADNITYFESGNKIYNVPYEEEWLD